MNTITCPHCGKEVEISQALTAQLEQEVLAREHQKHKKELDALRKEIEEKAGKKAKEELELRLKDSENEIEETKKRNKEQQEQLLSFSQTIRELKQKDEERTLEMDKKLGEVTQRAKNDAIKQLEQEHRLQDLEKDKKINDMLKTIEDLKRKGQQGSQQLQGEVQELDLENILRESFRDDEISPVAKGVTGADITQIVKTSRGNVCGIILIESKRTKTWGGDWVEKLKTDVRGQKASAGVLVSSVLPKDFPSTFGLYEGIFITDYASIVPLIELLREKMREVAYQKFVNEKSGEKAETLYSYFTGEEFRQKVEAIAEVYQDQILQISKEKAAFEKIWKMREAQAQKLITNAAGIYGTVQGVVGKSILEVKALELLDTGEDELGLIDEKND